MDHRKKSLLELTQVSLEEYREMEKLTLAVLLDSVRSMQNVGSVFRTCDAFGVSELLLCGITGRPPHPDLHKSALGAEESVSWRYSGDALATCREMREKGWKIAALEQVHQSIPLNEFRLKDGERLLLVAGNEVKGVDQAIVDEADYILEIPQCGIKHSLNVSVSAGIAIWQIYSQIIEMREKR